MRRDAAEPRVIAALAFPGVQLLDIVGPLETFHLAARQLADEGHREPLAYRVEIIGEAERVASWSGLGITAQRNLDAPLDDIDTLIVPGAASDNIEFFNDERHLALIRRARRTVRRLCSVCSGAFVLAAAGVLDGRRATTHWKDAAALRERFPAVTVEPDRIFVEDDGIWTSGGITAGIDLALRLVEQDHSRQLALQTAKRLLVFLKRPGDQAQFSQFLDAQARPTRFAALLEWIPEHLDEDLGVRKLAARSFMSERSFRRHFVAETGFSPSEFVARARLGKAQSLLEGGDTPLAMVARQCGYPSGDALRRAFQRTLGVSPSDYRARFNG